MIHFFSNIRQIKGLHALKLISEKQKIKQEEVVSLLKVVMVFDIVHQTTYLSCNYRDKQDNILKE